MADTCSANENYRQKLQNLYILTLIMYDYNINNPNFWKISLYNLVAEKKFDILDRNTWSFIFGNEKFPCYSKFKRRFVIIILLNLF